MRLSESVSERLAGGVGEKGEGGRGDDWLTESVFKRIIVEVGIR